MCNFGRGYYEEQFREIILNFGQWFRRRCRCTYFSFLPIYIPIATIVLNILNKSENATLQLSIFCEKVLDKNFLLKLNNVSLTSSKRFVETPPSCLV